MSFPLFTTSSDVARTFDEPVAFVFIDGAHEYESVKQDFDDWFPKVVNGGIVALHDAVARPGPQRVARDFVLRSRSFRRVRFVHQLVYAQKTDCNGVADVVWNRYMLWLIRIVGFASSLNLPRSLKEVGGRIAVLLQKPGAHDLIDPSITLYSPMPPSRLERKCGNAAQQRACVDNLVRECDSVADMEAFPIRIDEIGIRIGYVAWLLKECKPQWQSVVLTPSHAWAVSLNPFPHLVSFGWEGMRGPGMLANSAPKARAIGISNSSGSRPTA